MRVLVTGGGGFVGGAVVRCLLARGDEVTSYARGAYPDLQRLGVRVERGDVADEGAVRRAVAGHDAVIHTAAKAGAWGAAAAYRSANVDGTRSVLRACRAQGVRRLVFTSSPSVVFGGRDIAGGREADLHYPVRHPAAYPATKAQAERLVLAANGSDLATVALRPHLVWGPGDPHLLPRIVDRARRGRLALVGDGRNLIDATYVDNAAQAHLDALDRLRGPGSAPAGRAYFIAQGEPVPLRGLLAMMLRAAGAPPLRRRVPLAVAWAVGALMEVPAHAGGDAVEPLMTRFLARQLATAHWFDLSAARRDLGYAPAVSTAEGMRRLRAHLSAADDGTRQGPGADRVRVALTGR